MAPHILVINDEPLILAQIDKWLTRAGYRVHTSETGGQGEQLVSQNSYDLIVVDYNLKAEQDGAKTALDYIPTFKRLNPVAPIIVTSATRELISIPMLLKKGVAKVILADRSFFKRLLMDIIELFQHTNAD
ncbi:response regulator [candidate division KSB1 bacterium]|nr:response regulator [candidate division KSB1 bacterium]